MDYISYNFPANLIHQSKTISSGETDTVYLLTMPTKCYGFIEEVGLNNFNDCYFYWYVDGQDVEGKIEERQIGSISEPKRYYPREIGPVKREIRFTAYNGSSRSQEFEVYCNGTIYWRPSKR